MPGSRPTGFLSGASAERLAEFMIASFAFTTPVPYTDDIGHDLHCVLHRPAKDRRTLRAGPAFSVQVKSKLEPLLYKAGTQAEWLSDQANPFFVCLVDRAKLEIALYSTWNVHNAHLLHGPKATMLHVDTPIETFGLPTLTEDTLNVPLGPPVLRLTAEEVVDPQTAMHWADILEPWIELDRDNIVNRRAEMYWIMGPHKWVTNQALPVFEPGFAWMGGFYRNPMNIDRCVGNLLRSAVAVRRIMDQIQLNGAELGRPREENALDALLDAFDAHLDPLARHALRERDAEIPPQH